MRIEEIIRSCANERVADAAVTSIGPRFACTVGAAAEIQGMSLGGFTAMSVERFARDGDAADRHAVLAAMRGSQEPILAGLHRILSITLASNRSFGDPCRTALAPAIPAPVCAWQLETRRERHYA